MHKPSDSDFLCIGDPPTDRGPVIGVCKDDYDALVARVKELEAGYDDQKWKRYAAEMVLAHTASARNAVLEEAAKVAAHDFECIEREHDAFSPYADGQEVAGIRIAAAIRALKSEEKE